MTSATERVGRYQLLEPIGVGPSGSVSRAKVFGVAGFERQFAVKRFHHELTAATPLATALSTAARGYGSLEHPRIARMSEFGVAQGMTFTAVEYVAGLDALRLIAEARLAGTTLAAGGALALVSQAARAIGYAHGRGLTHLGLAPTNVIVTAEGDIKITDFGILAATLPQRPTEQTRLAHRIQYLAPEQLANEATSAATDVFALGVLAFELVTGQRTFRGETPAQIAQSVMAGPPAEPPLPRPIVRVLQRCLARSPFERFPDARALADALDAALRVAPVPGTRKDIGAQVQTTLDRIAAMNEGEMSGMLAVDIGTGPVSKGPQPVIARESEAALDPRTLEFVRPDAPVPGPTPLVGPATLPPPSATVPELKAFQTVPGHAPPPIPVPQGVSAPPPASTPPSSVGTSTLLGLTAAKSSSPIPLAKLDLKGKKPNANVPNVPALPRTSRKPDPSALSRAIEVADVIPPSSIGVPLPLGNDQLSDTPVDTELTSESSAAHRRMTDEMSPVRVEKHSNAHTKATSELSLIEHARDESPNAAHGTEHEPLPSESPEPVEASLAASMTPAARPTLQRRSRLPWILAGTVGLAALGVGGWFAYNEFIAPSAASDTATAKVVTPAPRDAGAKATADAAAAPADAAVAIAPPTPDAAMTVSADAAIAVTPPIVPDAAVAALPPDAATATASDHLVITSTPSRARVFLDGADVGATPLKLDGTPDRHTIAVLLPGHELYVAQVDGHGAFEIPLKEVTPLGGPAGIKVTRCKDKDRYYVYVDSKPTGMTCPTERIEVDLGPHVVEVYDVVSDSRKKYEVEVKDTRLSVRVKIE